MYVLPSFPVNVTCVAFTAATVKVDELPEVIEVGFAVMLTVGPELVITVTVVADDVLPPAPLAVAVNVVVTVGLTACVPPLGCSVYVLLSLPVTVT